jgi:hypothetical protein
VGMTLLKKSALEYSIVRLLVIIRVDFFSKVHHLREEDNWGWRKYTICNLVYVT